MLFHFGVEYREDKLAPLVKATPEIGTPHENMISLAKSLGFETARHVDLSLDELKKYIASGRPVIVAMQVRRWSSVHDLRVKLLGCCWKQAWVEEKSPDWTSKWGDGALGNSHRSQFVDFATAVARTLCDRLRL